MHECRTGPHISYADKNMALEEKWEGRSPSRAPAATNRRQASCSSGPSGLLAEIGLNPHKLDCIDILLGQGAVLEPTILDCYKHALVEISIAVGITFDWVAIRVLALN